MKSRRLATLNDIQTECMKLITLFKPQPAMIKKRIESLVEREFLERDPEDRTRFKYVS